MELYSETFVIVVQFVALVGLINICIVVSTMRVRNKVLLSELTKIFLSDGKFIIN